MSRGDSEPGRTGNRSSHISRRDCLRAGFAAGLAGGLAGLAKHPAVAQNLAAGITPSARGYFHPWLNDPIVEAVAGGVPPQRVQLTPDGLTSGLCGAVQHYRAVVEAGGWPVIPDPGLVLERDVTDRAVGLLRRRLRLSGDLPGVADQTSDTFDVSLENAVKAFQSRHGLEADGAVGPATLAELNVPANVRLATLVINVERARQWAKDYGDRFIAVNIAAGRLHLIEGGNTVFDTRVIVGRIDRTTPIIHSKITRLDFNPFWYCPDSIARRDLLPAIQTDPDYFFNNGIRVLTSFSNGAEEIPPEEIDWFSYDGIDNLPYKFRQDPGPWNVLGPVRFNFNNNHSVYLHGTSNEELFEQATRTFSSGCVRVDGALDISAYLASAHDKWDVDRVQGVVESYKTRSVTLDDPMPVHLIYRTAWVDHDGTVQFRPDVYDWDAVLDIKWRHVADVPCVYGLRQNAEQRVLDANASFANGG
ncbi:MAG: L,D-transpeptidase family protein [Alphaproteobacteria bacterium]|nr:L,D-transpeptidase family protein [Alphaproteobacteria bacterium SS10]